MTEEDICGESFDIYYNKKKKITKLNLELVKVSFKNSKDSYYEIHFEEWSRNKCKTFFKLHIKEAIELKSKIDTLVYSALSGENND